MDILKYAVLPFFRYFDFSGRSNRAELWAFSIFAALVGASAHALDHYILLGLPFFKAVQSLVFLLPWWGVNIRRFHDVGQSGWRTVYYVLVPALVMIAGGFFSVFLGQGIVALAVITAFVIMLYGLYLLYLARGDDGPNPWGDAYGQEDHSTFAESEQANHRLIKRHFHHRTPGS